MKKAELISYSKGIAILGIILFHLISGYFGYLPVIGKASSFGGAGVHVFIVCSGFGLMYSYIRKPLNFVSFIKKRFVKVYLPYIIVVLIAFLLPNVYSRVPNRYMALLSHIFLFKMFVPAFTNSFGFQFWYISTIIQFYLVFTLLAKLLNKLGHKKFLIICCTTSFIWAVIVSLLGFTENRVWNSFFLQYLWEFAIGMILACEYAQTNTLKVEQISIPKIFAVTLISFIIYSILSIIGGFLKVFNDPFSLVAFGGMCLLLYRLRFLPSFVNFTSRISYEIYLTHVLIYRLLFEVYPLRIPPFITAIIALIAIYLVSWLYNIACQKILFNNSKTPRN